MAVRPSPSRCAVQTDSGCSCCPKSLSHRWRKALEPSISRFAVQMDSSYSRSPMPGHSISQVAHGSGTLDFQMCCPDRQWLLTFSYVSSLGLTGGAWHLDPRLPGVLGLRAVLPANQQPSALQGAAPSTEPQYRAWRYMHGVSEGEVEMPTGVCACTRVCAPVCTCALMHGLCTSGIRLVGLS